MSVGVVYKSLVISIAIDGCTRRILRLENYAKDDLSCRGTIIDKGNV